MSDTLAAVLPLLILLSIWVLFMVWTRKRYNRSIEMHEENANRLEALLAEAKLHTATLERIAATLEAKR